MNAAIESDPSMLGTARAKDAIWSVEYPFASHYLQLASHLRLHYVDEGPKQVDGQGKSKAVPTLLCVHGNPTWSFYYRSIISEFSRDSRVIALDHIGCGLSDKPQQYAYTLTQHTHNLIRLIDELELNGITLVVHDWGGAIGLNAAIERPQLFKNILLLNTAAFPPPYIPLRIAACRIPWIGSLAIRHCNAFAWAATFMAIDRLPKLNRIARAGLLAPYDSSANRVAIDGFVRDIPRTKSHPTWNVLDRLEQNLAKLNHCNIRFVWGMKDWCFVPGCMERMRKHWPNASTVELADVGHYVMEEAPREVIEQLRSLIQLSQS